MKSKEINLLELHCNQRGVALVISLLILVMVTALGMTGIMTSTSEIKLGGNERIATEALYAADAGIQHALRALRGQDFGVVTAAAQPWLSVNDFNGVPGLNYSVEVSQTNANGDVAPPNTVFVTSTATYPSGERKKIEAEVRNLSTDIPVNASLGIAGSFSKMKFGGSTTINGNLPQGEKKVKGSSCAEDKAGVAVDTVSTYEEIKVKNKKKENITGIGLDPSIQLRPADMSPGQIQAIADTLAANADRTILVDNQKVKTEDVIWGTAANPEVTVITMTGKKGRIKFKGDTSGYGILIINSKTTKKGRVEFTGDFTWNGLIIVTGDSGLDKSKIVGNSSITGGLILANTSADPSEENYKFKANGNSTIQYSCTVLTAAVNNSPLSLNAWHEIL